MIGLSEYVDVRIHARSFTITLMRMLEETPRPQFDFCYFDGAHTWDGTGFSSTSGLCRAHGWFSTTWTGR